MYRQICVVKPVETHRLQSRLVIKPTETSNQSKVFNTVFHTNCKCTQHKSVVDHKVQTVKLKFTDMKCKQSFKMFCFGWMERSALSLHARMKWDEKYRNKVTDGQAVIYQ